MFWHYDLVLLKGGLRVAVPSPPPPRWNGGEGTCFEIPSSIAAVLRVGHEDAPLAILFVCMKENIKSSQLNRIHESIERNVNQNKVNTYFFCRRVMSGLDRRSLASVSLWSGEEYG